MPDICTLVIYCDLPGLVYINGTAAGWVTENTPISLPVLDTGQIFITYYPADGRAIVICERLLLQNGIPQSGNFLNMHLCCYEDAILEVHLNCVKMASVALPSAIATLTHDSMVAEVYRGNGFFLTIQDEAIFTYPLPEDLSGVTLFVRNLTGSEDLIVKANTATGEYIAAFKKNNGWNCILDKRSGSVYLPEETPCTIGFLDDLADVAGHALYSTYEFDGERYVSISSSVEWADGKPRPITGVQNAGSALVQSVLLGCKAECTAYLSGGKYTFESLQKLFPPNAYLLETKYKKTSLKNEAVVAVGYDKETIGYAKHFYLQFEKTTTGYTLLDISN